MAMGSFDSSSDIVEQLEDTYVRVLQKIMGLSLSEAKSTVSDMLNRAKEESLKEGTSNLSKNYGDMLLERENTDENIKSMLIKKRNEGVRDDDIKWWWNMHDLERRMMIEIDAAKIFATFQKLTKEFNVVEEKALKIIRKSHPIFGNPGDTSDAIGEDRPLPYELMDRINIYIEKMWHADSEKCKKEVEKSSTLNALIRKEIKQGNIQATQIIAQHKSLCPMAPIQKFVS